jgi:nicotinate-nucleotide pyrophosphorylase (carboxylating)
LKIISGSQRDLSEVKEIVACGGFRILLDNFDYENQKSSPFFIGDQSLTESSGNINEETIRAYADGVNYISSGALTHSVYNTWI